MSLPGAFRLIVLDAGRVVEDGTHEELLRSGGHYARLWRHQSGGFLPHDIVATETETEPPEADDMRAEAPPEASVEDASLPTRT